MKNSAETSVPIASIIAERFSPRAFDGDREIEQEKIIALCEAARWAPSSAGEEPWKFIVFNKFRDKNTWEKVLSCLDKYNKIWAVNAPVIIAGTAHTKWDNDPDVVNKWAEHDLGAASENLHLQAVELGLRTHPMGGFDLNKFQSEFNIPKDYKVLTLIAVAYPGNLEQLDEFNRKREYEKRKRKNLGDLFFDSAWGKPII